MSIITNPPGLMGQPMSHTQTAWDQAIRRHAEAQDQINAARANPTEAELEAKLSDAALQETPAVKQYGSGEALNDGDCRPHHVDCAADLNHNGICTRADGTAILAKRAPPTPPSLTLTGARLDAYLAVEAASQRALAAQNASAAASADLRACIEALCRLMAPAKDGG
jgi:hypothetical protein